MCITLDLVDFISDNIRLGTVIIRRDQHCISTNRNILFVLKEEGVPISKALQTLNRSSELVQNALKHNRIKNENEKIVELLQNKIQLHQRNLFLLDEEVKAKSNAKFYANISVRLVYRSTLMTCSKTKLPHIVVWKSFHSIT